MKEKEFVEKLAEKINQTKKDTQIILDELVALLVKTVKGGDEVVFSDMGKFLVKKRPAREARNPITGATVKVPAKVVPAFRPNKRFKEAVIA